MAFAFLVCSTAVCPERGRICLAEKGLELNLVLTPHSRNPWLAQGRVRAGQGSWLSLNSIQKAASLRHGLTGWHGVLSHFQLQLFVNNPLGLWPCWINAQPEPRDAPGWVRAEVTPAHPLISSTGSQKNVENQGNHSSSSPTQLLVFP